MSKELLESWGFTIVKDDYNDPQDEKGNFFISICIGGTRPEEKGYPKFLNRSLKDKAWSSFKDELFNWAGENRKLHVRKYPEFVLIDPLEGIFNIRGRFTVYKEE